MASNQDTDKKFTVSSIAATLLPVFNIMSPYTDVCFVCQIMFDTSKKEMLNPNQGYKKIVQKLKNRYKVILPPQSFISLQCEINKEELSYKKMVDSNLLLLGGPRMPFTAKELQDVRQYIEGGGSALVIMQEGGETKMQTNINAMLEQFGIFVNTDCVIRKAFAKYLHPKEAYIGNGCLNKELVRVANGEAKTEQAKKGKYAKRYRDTKDETHEKDEDGGLKFVYPYGATLNVRKPAVPILSSGPISFPPNRPVAAFYNSQKGGKLFVLGSIKFFSDEFFENDDNQKI